MRCVTQIKIMYGCVCVCVTGYITAVSSHPPSPPQPPPSHVTRQAHCADYPYRFIWRSPLFWPAIKRSWVNLISYWEGATRQTAKRCGNQFTIKCFWHLVSVCDRGQLYWSCTGVLCLKDHAKLLHRLVQELQRNYWKAVISGLSKNVSLR